MALEDFTETFGREEDATPRAEPAAFMLADETRIWRTWKYRSKHSREDMLAAGYFDSVASHGLRQHDKIEVVASACDKSGAEYFDLRCIMDERRPGSSIHIWVEET